VIINNPYLNSNPLALVGKAEGKIIDHPFYRRRKAFLKKQAKRRVWKAPRMRTPLLEGVLAVADIDASPFELSIHGFELEDQETQKKSYCTTNYDLKKALTEKKMARCQTKKRPFFIGKVGAIKA